MIGAVWARAGWLWRPTIGCVVVQPADGHPLSIDRRAGPVLARLERARPLGVDAAELVGLTADLAVEDGQHPGDAATWVSELLVLLESIGVVTIERGSSP